MDNSSLGSTKKYKMLAYLVDKIELMEDKDRAYILSFFNDFHNILKKLQKIDDAECKKYLADLVLRDFNKRGDDFIIKKHGEKIGTYTKNYIKARMRDLRRTVK